MPPLSILRFFTSLSFLYLLAIGVIIIYGALYYRDFVQSRYQRRRFPVIFFIITAACIFFLWSNMHAPLQLKTFSNLDHHFIRHDGFAVNGAIELGRSDTANDRSASFNRFVFSRKSGNVTVSAPYSEDPFYISGDTGYRIASVSYPAVAHAISFQSEKEQISFRVISENEYELKVGDNLYKKEQVVKRGISCWNIFRDEEGFINSPAYNDERVVNCLKNILVLRDNILRKKGGEARFFLSGRVFAYVNKVTYDNKEIHQQDQRYEAVLPDKSNFAWGIGFLDNNRSQMQVRYGGKDSFSVLNRYPVAYPLTEESRQDWGEHGVSKFLVSDSKDMLNMPTVFREGFMFSSYSEDKGNHFIPVLLSYRKAAENQPVQLKARQLYGGKEIPLTQNTLFLPAQSGGANWIFTIRNTYDWEFGGFTLTAGQWQLLVFGGIAFFFLLIFFTSLVKPAEKLSWVWQLLSCIVIVLLTTRFFLYWRYKSFPPYEGMDLPSQQQLNSFSNFGIILLATFLLGIIFGYSFLKYAYVSVRKKAGRLLKKPYYGTYNNEDILVSNAVNVFSKKISSSKKFSARFIFFVSWSLLLLGSGGFAAINNFDPGVCRHLAIGLVIAYFVYLFISYKHSPLVSSASESWWNIGTRKALDIVVSNPVKILLSVSLLAVFVFIDIGFAIVFLNFLLFNEAFLCINYSIAGLSTGSRRNAGLFGALALVYLALFIVNLLFAPYIFDYLLRLSGALYITGYVLFGIILAYVIVRLLTGWAQRKKAIAGFATAIVLFLVAFLFFPKERILKKAEVTRFRIDVLTTPIDQAIESAYKEGKTYEPVIRAAQNQWFINTFIDEDNNPGVQSTGFNLLAHAPQNKGARYNAQATDLVASRFFIAEHGKWSVLLYVLLLLLPIIMLGSFYKLYPDFTNRINNNYPTVTAGFSVLNYLLITALLVILAATGRYIFFGQDLPFGSILSKQSVLFPCVLIVAAVLLFRDIAPQHYANRKKMIPGAIVFMILGILLFLVKPSFNKNKEFGVADLSKEMDNYIQLRLQPVLEHFDTSASTRRLSLIKKDQLFSDSVRKMLDAGMLDDGNLFFANEITAYAHTGFARHLDQRKMLYLDPYTGSLQLTVNDNYFRVEPPPHLQELWTGNVFGDSTAYNIALWDAGSGAVVQKRIIGYTNEPVTTLSDDLQLSFRSPAAQNIYQRLYLVNQSSTAVQVNNGKETKTLHRNDSILLNNPDRMVITNAAKQEFILSCEPDAYMKNYYVNGSRFYVYPLESRFIWARNFAESISSEYTSVGNTKQNAFVSFDYELMDSLSSRIKYMMSHDSAYKKGAEYGITIADGNGRVVAMTDFIKGLARPDPNNKSAFNTTLAGDNGFVSQSQLRKQIGNINLLRLNPGPGSTLKPIVFSAIASQLDMDWDAFAADGFTEPQRYYGGEKVAEYDFEKNNGTISKVTDYLKYSDNYYHSNVLLLGSYPKQAAGKLLSDNFVGTNPEAKFHWPYFSYKGKRYWLENFKHWPGFFNGKANFGMDSSFVSIGLLNNYGIYTKNAGRSFEMFPAAYDSLLFRNAYRKSGFILPENSLFDQQGASIDHRIPYDLFTTSFRGHVKGSSQVMIPPVKMTEVFGKMISQSRNYSLTLNPYARAASFSPFYVDGGIVYNNYLTLMRESVFEGMRQALFGGTAAALGAQLKDGAPYYYYAKTGTTGDNEVKTKSKLLVLIVSAKKITDPGFNFRNNKFYTIYFTSQNGPAKQNEQFQAAVINYLQSTPAFARYMQK